MAQYPIVIPRLGEAVIEATLTRWLKNEGDPVKAEEPVAEIATDKVDSEITSPVDGVLRKKLAQEGEVVGVGKVIAEILTEGESPAEPQKPVKEVKPEQVRPAPEETKEEVLAGNSGTESASGTRFYSPLVRNIAKQEHISFDELGTIRGTGAGDRITKQDLIHFIETRKSATGSAALSIPAAAGPEPPVFKPGSGDRVIEMDRIRQLISAHMVRSVQTSPHVTSFAEVDMTRIVVWREKNKTEFQKRHGEKLTFTPLILEAISKTVRDFPMVNVSVDGSKIILHPNINIGMAVALPNDNLIVPVIRNAGEMNLLGIIKKVNDLADRSRKNKLLPDEVTGGTISFTNLGSFGTLMGTPIINQPQCAIVAVGTIRKRPVVIESPEGDSIAVRSMMMASVTYDHRVIDGALGGRFLARFTEYLEQFDTQQSL